MGDIAFNIFKDVDLNKTVDLDINKNVDVDVNINGQLATAEADAEAFGSPALAEVDAYTFVTEGNGEPQPVPSLIDVLGNTSVFELGPDDLAGSPDPENPGQLIPPLIPGSDGAADTITVNFTTPVLSAPGGETVPNVDDVNGFQRLAPWTSPPPATPDAGIPSPFLSFSSDLELSQTGFVPAVGAIVEAEYVLDLGFDGDLSGELVINFGDRGPVDLNGDGVANPGDLLLYIPEGTLFLAEYLGEGEVPPLGPIELEFESFDGNSAYWLHTGELRSDNPLLPTVSGIPADAYEVPSFELIAESLQSDIANIGDWALEATGLFYQPGDGDGQAFAYAESTAALGGDAGGGIIG